MPTSPSDGSGPAPRSAERQALEGRAYFFAKTAGIPAGLQSGGSHLCSSYCDVDAATLPILRDKKRSRGNARFKACLGGRRKF